MNVTEPVAEVPSSCRTTRPRPRAAAIWWQVRDAADLADPHRRDDDVFEQIAAQVAQLLPPVIGAARRLAWAL